MKSLIIIFIVVINYFTISAQTGWQQINSFGSNPGNLDMYIYVPTGIQSNAPIVVAMHGCTQTALICSDNTGWNSLADKYKFIVIYPEQKSTNNSSYCFNWFLAGDQGRDAGEALSVKQMIDYVKNQYSVDDGKIFVTGLSAGAGMSVVMASVYPDIFNAGAIMAGVPYKAATDALSASNAMYGLVSKTPSEWKALVTGAFPSYTGQYPRISVFHGLYDNVVSPNNITELVKQWTAVHNSSQVPSSTISAFNGNSDIEQTAYKDVNNDTIVLVYKINLLGHAIAVDPGTGITQGGNTGTYSVDKNFYSSYWAAKFFGLITDTSNEIENLSIHYNNLFKTNTSICTSINNSEILNFRIIDIYGKTFVSGNESCIEINTLASGIYVANIMLKNKQILNFIFIK